MSGRAEEDSLASRECDAEIHAYTSYGRSAPSARVRLYGWVDGLPAATRVIQPGVGQHKPSAMLGNLPNYLRHLWELLLVKPSTVSFVQREVSPWASGTLERRALRGGDWSVYDFDDAIFLDRGALFGRRSGRWFAGVSAADAVIAGNDYLADAASAYAKNVHVIPSCVHSERYSVKQDYSILASRPRCVWVGSSSTERYLEPLLPVFDRLSQERGLRLTLIGAKDGLARSYIDRWEWSEGVAEARISEFDFGIMPLTDGPWERGKCAYKLIQYGAAGLPTVASPVGVNVRIQQEWGAPAPKTDDEWFHAIATIIDDQSLRQKIGVAARAGVEAHYSYSSQQQAWLSAVMPAA